MTTRRRTRRALVPVVALLLVGSAGAASAAVPVAGAGTVCTLRDARLAEASGVVWAPDGVRVITDSGTPSSVYRLGRDCAVAGVRPAPVEGRDVEDLARGADGTFWLADVGDNDRTRQAVAIVRLPPGGGEVTTSLVYPDGPHDAETLLLPADGRPVIVTKDLGGRSGVYAPDTALPAPPAGTGPTSTPTLPLRRVGDVVVPSSTTPGGPVGPFGAGLVTGGALSADGRVAALRTYTDAWLYPVDGTSAEAVITGLTRTPVGVPLPDEPQGEGVAFTPDGTLLSVGESPSGRPRATLRAVAGATARVSAGEPTTTAPATPGATDAVAGAGSPGSGPSAGAVGVAVGLGATALVVVVVLVARRRSRR